MKALINADDFGFTSNTNRAIIDAYDKGRVTELSLMVDAFATKEAVEYIKDNKVEDVGLHFSLIRTSQNGKILGGKDYDYILKNWTKEQLVSSFNDEVNMFIDMVGFTPKHINSHKHIALHPKLVESVSKYCQKNNCYARKGITHETIKVTNVAESVDLGRTAGRILGFKYDKPETMYSAYKKELTKAKKDGLDSVEIIFHPGYAGTFEEQYTSFIQERIDDINFLLSDYFLRLVEEENLELVPSSQI